MRRGGYNEITMLVGKELGPYIIDKELGSGAMGTVYRARHKSSGERAAIKLMSPALGTSEGARARFVRELDILKQLHHPNIVRYKGSGRYHGAPFFIMEYVEGDSLDHVMERRDRLTWEEIVELGMQLCAALKHSHDKGIIHRDLKPSNIMVLRDGTVKLTDFGIAKDTDVTALTAANSTVGTASYMSPEQCRGARDITYKSDLYSLGVLLYELLTGRKPFTADTAMEMFLKHANAPFAPPSQFVIECPVWLNTLICQLMEKKPEQRPLNADAVAQGLQLVRDKMAAQQSAAADAARKRRADRASTDVALDEKDRDAARAMLGKKKKRKKAAPFYRRGWFTILALAVLVVGFAAIMLTIFSSVGIYLGFLRPPSAENLYAQAEELMKSENDDDHKAARDGPITDFLSHYPAHEKTRQVQAWADQVDSEILERQMLNRRNAKFAPEKGPEETFRLALDNEDLGKLDEAGRHWGELVRYKTDREHPEERPWGLIGEKHVKELREVERTRDQLKALLRSEKILGTQEKGASEFEEQALQALRLEAAGNDADARAAWQDLRKLTESRPEQRVLYLLAVKRSFDLKSNE
jgi:serine/threonine-protein kinase